MRSLLKVFGAASLALVVAIGAYAASVPLFTGPTGSNPVNFPAALPDLNTLITEINAAITPQSIATWNPNRNVLDNGAMAVVQRGLGGTEEIGAINGSACLAVNYMADRWCIDTNVASGAGYGLTKTSTPSPPTGFQRSMVMYRKTGALQQPVCAIQEVSSNNSVPLQGQNVVVSYYAQALAGLSADNGNVINVYTITGTGTDDGLGTWTASPAITPAWTGIAAQGGTAQTITTAWVRYQFTVNLPVGATELGVMLCFTPTATGAGTTDGFAFTGVQLEQGTTASPFAFQPYLLEFDRAQYFYQEVPDAATTVTYPATCTTTTADSATSCNWVLAHSMRTAPTVVVLTATSFGITKAADGTAGACSTLAVIATSSSKNSTGFTCALSATAAVGTMHRMIGGNSGTANTISFSSDF